MLIPVFETWPLPQNISPIDIALQILPYKILHEAALQNLSNSEYPDGASIIYQDSPSIDQITASLNNGLDTAILSHSYFSSISTQLQEAKVPINRLGLQISNAKEFAAVLSNQAQLENVGLILLTIPGDLIDILKLSSAIKEFRSLPTNENGLRKIVVDISQNISTHNESLADQTELLNTLGIDTAISSNLFTLTSKRSSQLQGKIYLPDAFLCGSGLKSDREDGLFTTAVMNETGVCLGVAFSSIESIAEAFKTSEGVYWSRKRGLWHKGKTSGATQKLVRVNVDCDSDLLQFVVNQTGSGFCHNNTFSCFDSMNSNSVGMLSKLSDLLQTRLSTAPEGSYTQRLFNDRDLLNDKLLEEAKELCDATTKQDVAWEAADLLYFALVKCTASGVSLADVERNLNTKHKKIFRRPGNSKNVQSTDAKDTTEQNKSQDHPTEPKSSLRTSMDHVVFPSPSEPIAMRSFNSQDLTDPELKELLKRPIIKSEEIMQLVKPIVEGVKNGGDAALKKFTAAFDKVELDTVVLKPPFAVPDLPESVKSSIDVAYNNILTFHRAQLSDPIVVETMPGVVCSRFSRPIERVGVYVPGGTAVLPSTALMLGVPAQAAGCKEIVIASPPGKDGNLAAEVMYVAHLVNATAVVKAGGAQAVAALAYGTETVPKVDKICGPGNQFVTSAKMMVQNDVSAMVSIDMPAGPSELLVVADKTSVPKFIASDLLSQAEHGTDSQVVLLAVNTDKEFIDRVNDEVNKQANRLPRVDIVRKSIPKSYILAFSSMQEAINFSNDYAPEHLILQIDNAESYVPMVQNAGSIFVGKYSPESCGDYASGTNHTLPTYGFSKMYSGVNVATFQKHITSQTLTKKGLELVGPSVMTLAEVEGLEAHRNAVAIRFTGEN